MHGLLTKKRQQQWRKFRQFADDVVGPEAASIDASETLSPAVVRALGDAGLTSALLPERWGGAGMDMASYGLLSEELGRTCSNVRNFVAVQDMVSHAIWRWGTNEQKECWLGDIAAGRAVAAFLLTEPDTGSDAQNITTSARRSGEDLVVSGTKRWISFGQCADVFLTFVQYEERHSALLIDRLTPGIHVEPLHGMLGLRGSMLAEITFEECRVPVSALVGNPGAGLVFVGSASLDIGRYSTAWGCVGLAQACLDASTSYARQRVQYGAPLVQHQLVQRMLADMLARSRSARLLCWQAGSAADRAAPDATYDTLLAKYLATTTAAASAADAVQLQGAAGMSAMSSVGRFYRDAKAMEIIEGTTQILQELLGKWSVDARHPTQAEDGR